jgi:DNA-binding NarL/FixJ family response regulator
VAEALEHCQSLRPAILLTDVLLPGGDAFAILEALAHQAPAIKVVVMAPEENPTWLARSVAWSAQDYLLRSVGRDELVNSLHRVRLSQPWPAEHPLERMSQQMTRRRDFPKTTPPLTGREMQVARLLGLGLPNREMALALRLSPETVKEHVQNLLRKLGATDRTQAAVLTIQNRWL